jgi:hypothetical protein
MVKACANKVQSRNKGVFKLIIKKVKRKGLMGGGLVNAKLQWCFSKEIVGIMG